MSQENLEITRRSVDAFNRRDLDAWLAEFDPEIVWYAFPEEPEPGPFRGLQAVRTMAARWMDLLPDLRIEVKQYIDAGDHVIMPARMSGHTPDSDADILVDEVYVNECRDGKIVEVREYRTRAEALEAVGLAEH
jgi:ketosteroid isomerase-like protein